MACFRPFFGFQKLIIQFDLPLNCQRSVIMDYRIQPAGRCRYRQRRSVQECCEGSSAIPYGNTRGSAGMRVTRGSVQRTSA